MNASIPKRLVWTEGMVDPIKRAKALREAIAKGRIKRSEITDDILALLDQIAAQERQSA